jgi:hypothetical protein
MRGLVLLIAAAALITCTTGPAASPTAPSPSPLTEEETWKELSARAIQLPTVASGSECPVTPTTQRSSVTGALAGSGPVYAVGNVMTYGSPRSDGLLGGKVLWVAAPDYHGPALIRGRQLDGPGGIFFSNSRRVTELRFEPDTAGRASASDQGWRYLPSTVDVEQPGCYGFQLDGPGWTSTIVMRALA